MSPIKYIKLILLLVVAITVLTFTSCGDEEDPILTGTLIGTITNALSEGSGTPVPNAVVTLSGGEANSITTGNDGSYRFDDLNIGDYTVSVSHPDYEPGETAQLTVRSLEETRGDLALTPKPAITVSPSSLDFGDSRTEISLSFKNVISTQISYEITAPNQWIEISRSTGTLQSQNSANILVTVDRSEMQLGLNEGTLTINIAGRASADLVVTALNNPESPLEISPTQLDFGSDEDEKALLIKNTVNSAITYEVTKTADWIKLSKTEGTVNGLNQDNLVVTVDRASVDVGDYSGSLIFNIPESGSITVQVLMTKSPLASMTINPDEIDFGTGESSKEVTLSNPNGESINYSLDLSADWLSVNKTSGTLNANSQTSFTFTVNRSLLSIGDNQTSVSFTSQKAGTAVLTVLAEKVDASGANLVIEQGTLNFGEESTSLGLVLQNSGSATLSWDVNIEITSGQNWLSLNPTEGSIEPAQSDEIEVFINRSGLTNGDYQARLQFGGNGGDDEVVINMSVNESGSGGGGNEDDDNDGVINSVDADDDNDGLIEIHTIDDLNDMRNDLDADGTGLAGAPTGGFIGYELANDLDFENVDDYEDTSLKPTLTSGSGWLPIGFNNGDFNAEFEGNGFTISNLLINRTTSNSALFATTTFRAEIRNVHLSIKYLTGNDNVAGLIGYNQADVVGCSVSGDISSSGTRVGLLIGLHGQGKVSQCYTSGSVTSVEGSVGGLIGRLGNSSSHTWRVEYSYSTALVNGTTAVGGLIGYRYYGSGVIQSCYATGDVEGSGQSIGGLIGSFGNGEVLSCYAKGAVSSSSYYVGGLIGTNSSDGIISTCFSTGTVEGSSNIGGLVGRNTGSGSISSTNYWDINTSGVETSAGDATGQTTANLQGVTSSTSIYATWSSDAWDFGNSSQYPALKGMPNGVDAQR